MAPDATVPSSTYTVPSKRDVRSHPLYQFRDGRELDPRDRAACVSRLRPPQPWVGVEPLTCFVALYQKEVIATLSS